MFGRINHRQSAINHHNRGTEIRVLNFQTPTEFLRRGFNQHHQSNVRIRDESSNHTYPTGQTLNLDMAGPIMTQEDNEILCSVQMETQSNWITHRDKTERIMVTDRGFHGLTISILTIYALTKKKLLRI